MCVCQAFLIGYLLFLCLTNILLYGILILTYEKGGITIMEFQNMKIFERIKYIRKNELKITQEDFAMSIGLSRSNIGNIEVGRINVTDRVIQDICLKYNINETWLRYGTGEIFVVTEKSILDDLALAHNMSVKEKAIIQAFLDLSPQGRAGVLEYVDKLVQSLKDVPSEPTREEHIIKRINDTNKMIEQAAEKLKK